ncbi:energy transducer TonB [Dokdonia sinensis]|uniref:Energy transducer TonB n=1 Tax=Dokdonia sinensis TaxID=2479847 RepID=A0A3M0FXB1_9FLAO|nr:energy transducer TonB [Dokdonia sinensis]RMB57145.1 energy transducer TonB [Dokdonia sinensis]
MAYLDTVHKRKSFTISSIIMAIILLLMFVVGMKYLDPPIEGGIAVNFGTSDTGSGDIQPTQPVASAPKNTAPQPEPTPPEPEIKDEVVTQDNEDAPVIEEKPKETPKPKVEKPKDKPVEKPKEEAKPDPKPDQSTTSALDALINGPKSDGAAQQGQGNDSSGGDKGDPNGDPNASSYYGTGTGLDGDGNYQLGGRKALGKPKRQQDCNEAGIVVVSIEVDRNGKVIKAVPGVRGTTNNSRCLTEPAKAAALATKFNADSKAPSKQIGKIVYRFSLSD